MFTGIIEATARVLKAGKGRLVLERPVIFDDIKLGSSVSVSGVCLTVTTMDARSLTFDVMPETIAKTTIGGLSAGDPVNLERALPAHGRFEGHVVQGHVEGVGEVVGVVNDRTDVRVTILVSQNLRKLIIPKGSVAVDGISLTVAEAGPETFTVALIPTTLASTTLGGKRMGEKVNIETDILVRTLVALR